MGGRLEQCPSPQCGVEWFVSHPAGWRCTSCSTCVEEFQQPLGRYQGGDRA